MSIEKPVNERQLLYERFKQSLAHPDDDSEFFDADDLVIIIDQAVDNDDQYVEIEAILRGYRFFPDNVELRSRRAFLYFDLNLDEGMQNIRETLPADDAMTQILTLRQDGEGKMEPEKVRRLLDGILSLPNKFDDETIIQLVDCASACEAYDWLKENEKRLRKKTDYLPTLLYELFIVADLRHDRDYCIRLLEELTEIEPFNVDFWNALAQILVNIADGPNPNRPDFEGALAALELALAIEPNNINALTLKASIFLETDREAQAMETLRQFEGQFPTDSAANIYLRAVYACGEQERARAMALKLVQAFPESEDIVHVALVINAFNLEEILNVHFDSLSQADGYADQWLERAKQYYRHGDLTSAMKMLATLKAHGLLDYQGAKYYFTSLYCLRLYENCIIEFEDILNNNRQFIMPVVIIGGMMSYLKLGKKREAKKALKMLKTAFPLQIRDLWTLASPLETIGMSQFMTALDSMLNARGPVNVDDLDIFNFPNL